MALQIPVAYVAVTVPRRTAQRSWRAVVYRVGCCAGAILLCALVLRFKTSDQPESLAESTPPLSTHQAAVLDIVKNLTSLNASDLTDPDLIGTEIAPYTSEEWDAWEATHFPKGCKPTSTKELAPDGKLVDGDWGADCSEMKELDRRETSLSARFVSAMKNVPQLKSLPLSDLSKAVAKLQLADHKQKEALRQIIDSNTMETSNLHLMYVPSDLKGAN
jgi:hypothetical protein